MNNIGVDIDAFGDGSNGFYGKNYALAEGDKHFPLLDIPRAPMHSLVQFSGANIGTRLFEPTNAIGNSWKPPYIPQDSIYWNSRLLPTMTSSGRRMMPCLTVIISRALRRSIRSAQRDEYRDTGSLEATLDDLYGVTGTAVDDAAQANPALEPHVPSGKTSDDVVTDLKPNDDTTTKYGL